MDLRPGGAFDLTMHGPDGTDYKNKSIYKEIVPPERIVYEHLSAPKFTASITFVEQVERTLLTWHILFQTAASFQQVIKVFKADEGLQQNVEKLHSFLQAMQSR